LASRPNDAINFSQAGGSSRLERAGVWWISMPFTERINYQSYVDNIEYIEGKWHKLWGDRMNELVFIGQNIYQKEMEIDLEKCLLNESEVADFENGNLYEDPFPSEI
jgi:G3E family GTPase